MITVDSIKKMQSDHEKEIQKAKSNYDEKISKQRNDQKSITLDGFKQDDKDFSDTNKPKRL